MTLSSCTITHHYPAQSTASRHVPTLPKRALLKRRALHLKCRCLFAAFTNSVVISQTLYGEGGTEKVICTHQQSEIPKQSVQETVAGREARRFEEKEHDVREKKTRRSRRKSPTYEQHPARYWYRGTFQIGLTPELLIIPVSIVEPRKLSVLFLFALVRSI